jgi:predicted DNA-binding transcriptional regulator YafY
MLATLQWIPDTFRPDWRIDIARPTARVLALLELLQGGGVHTVPTLAERLSVDERTVRRYAAHLIDLGIPVEAQRGRYGGYRLAPGYKLPPLMFTDDEAVAVVLGLVLGERSGLVPSASAVAKVRRVLPAALAQRIEALMSTVDFTAPARTALGPSSPTALGDALLLLAEAARHHRSVQLEYTNWAGRSGSRGLDPYGLVFHSGRWYVTGRDHSRDAVRTFRIDRIGHVRLTGAEFSPPAEFDPVGHVLAGLAAVPYDHRLSVILHTDLTEARRRLPPAVGTLTAVAEGVRLQGRAQRLDGAAQMLASLGWPFTVESPDELRDEVRALAMRLHDWCPAVRTDGSEPTGR